MIERRKHPRFQRNKNALAEVRPYSVIVGQIIDISLGGLGFHYIDRGNRINDRFELNIWIENKLYMENVPVKTVSDEEISYMADGSTIPLKGCGVQFSGLTPEQSSNINNFILKLTGNDIKKKGGDNGH